MLSFYGLQLHLNKMAMVDCKDAWVDSVDRNQGAEFDIVILTTTVSADDGMAFADDIRRLTVAFTRARLGLIVIADVTALCQATNWPRVFKTLKDNGVPCLEYERHEVRAHLLGVSAGAMIGLNHSQSLKL
jgi:superfamily I DNA and/or RNA helicase